MKQSTLGAIYAISAFLLWGLLPIFWKELQYIPAPLIIAHRIIWSSLTLLIIILLRRRSHLLIEKLRSPRQLALAFIPGLLLACNWLIYVWATNHDKVVEISLGYYMLPILLILLGYLLLGEPLSRLRMVAVGIAALAVLLQAIGIGSLPLPALGVAISFGIYSIIKKKAHSDGFTSLILETGVLVPFAIAYLYLQSQSSSSVNIWGGSSSYTTTLIILTGAATVAPLLFFAAAAKRINLTTIGMLQFIAPTGQFLLGIYYFHEVISPLQFGSFALIWLAVILYAVPSRNS